MNIITKLLVADVLSIAVLMLGLPIILVLSLMECTGRCHGEPPSLQAQLRGFLFQVVGVLVGVPISYLVSYSLPTPHALWPALALPLALVVSDFLQYWEHRIEHHWLLWRIHAVHHSTREMTSTSNVSHFAHSTLMTIIYGLPIAAICGDPMSSISVVAFVYWCRRSSTHQPRSTSAHCVGCWSTTGRTAFIIR